MNLKVVFSFFHFSGFFPHEIVNSGKRKQIGFLEGFLSGFPAGFRI